MTKATEKHKLFFSGSIYALPRCEITHKQNKQ